MRLVVPVMILSWPDDMATEIILSENKVRYFYLLD